MTPVRSIPARNCAGAFGLFLFLVLLLIVGTASAGTPLEPIDTSSPRATLGSFLALTDEATELFSQYRRAPSPGLQAQIRALGEKGIRLLDLSQVPPVARREVGSEALYLLWDILARVELPALDQVPGGSEGVDGADQGAVPKRWRIPHTEITIARIQEGPEAGEYRFTPDTVYRSGEGGGARIVDRFGGPPGPSPAALRSAEEGPGEDLGQRQPAAIAAGSAA